MVCALEPKAFPLSCLTKGSLKLVWSMFGALLLSTVISPWSMRSWMRFFNLYQLVVLWPLLWWYSQKSLSFHQAGLNGRGSYGLASGKIIALLYINFFSTDSMGSPRGVKFLLGAPILGGLGLFDCSALVLFIWDWFLSVGPCRDIVGCALFTTRASTTPSFVIFLFLVQNFVLSLFVFVVVPLSLWCFNIPCSNRPFSVMSLKLFRHCIYNGYLIRGTRFSLNMSTFSA